MRFAIDAATIRGLLSYDAATGDFRWRPRTPDMFGCSNEAARAKCAAWNTRFAGKIAGAISPYGYRVIAINRKLHFAHRLAWLYVHGSFPAAQIDHRDGVRTNNAIKNLREATNRQNAQNQKRRSDNSSGSIGVSWDALTRKWRAGIQIDGHHVCLGRFARKTEAIAAYRAGKARLHSFQPVLREFAA